ncbi:MAG: response regulator transcription factor [Treponema sp.]|nr:response regulator transcription factor [Treponema sp.]
MKQLILLDDHTMILNGISSFIENSTKDWNIIAKLNSYENLETFLKTFSSSEPVVAVVDIELSKASESKTGFDAIRLLSQSGINSVVYSMYTSPSYLMQATEFGAKGYVSKSADDSELLEAINTVAKGESYIQKDLAEKMIQRTNIMLCLTKREREIAVCIKNHMDNQQIAEKFQISVRTVENHLSRLYDKLGTKNRHNLEEML